MNFPDDPQRLLFYFKYYPMYVKSVGTYYRAMKREKAREDARVMAVFKITKRVLFLIRTFYTICLFGFTAAGYSILFVAVSSTEVLSVNNTPTPILFLYGLFIAFFLVLFPLISLTCSTKL
jgi:hypothetical protein